MTSVERYINGAYFGDNPEWHEGDSPWKAGLVSDILSRHGISPSSIADVGCGTGGVLDCLRTSYPWAKLVGYELSPDAIALAPATRRSRIHLINGDHSSIAGSLDVCLLLDVIEHVEDYFTLVRELGSRSRYLVFHIPLSLSVQVVARSRPLLRSRKEVGHIHYFTRDTALAALKDCGMKVLEDVYTMASIDPLIGSSRLTTRLSRQPRRIGYRFAPHLTNRILGGSSLLVLAVPVPA